MSFDRDLGIPLESLQRNQVSSRFAAVNSGFFSSSSGKFEVPLSCLEDLGVPLKLQMEVGPSLELLRGTQGSS